MDNGGSVASQFQANFFGVTFLFDLPTDGGAPGKRNHLNAIVVAVPVHQTDLKRHDIH
jgi:hypothetical protein